MAPLNLKFENNCLYSRLAIFTYLFLFQENCLKIQRRYTKGQLKKQKLEFVFKWLIKTKIINYRYASVYIINKSLKYCDLTKLFFKFIITNDSLKEHHRNCSEKHTILMVIMFLIFLFSKFIFSYQLFSKKKKLLC